MIRISSVEIRGRAAVGPFSGSISFNDGLNIISADNAFGKSLAVVAVTWCLGLEPMYGLQDNDTSKFPWAVRDQVELEGGQKSKVLSSEAIITLGRSDGAKLRISRPIFGQNVETVLVEELEASGEVARTSELHARRETLKDRTGGLQAFFYSWLGLQVKYVATQQGKAVPLYLENLAPLFIIDQDEGWVDIQALQVFRYAQRDVAQASFEYLLGAFDALDRRLSAQLRQAEETRLKTVAEMLAVRIESLLRERGCAFRWSHHGDSSVVAGRWTSTTLVGEVRKQCHLDLQGERKRLEGLLSTLRAALTGREVSQVDATASSQTSQRVIELKTRRHDVRAELRKARLQLVDQQVLVEGLQHRLSASQDVLRLKTSGVGRLEVIECPTCHRDVDPSSFGLTQQSKESVSAHIEALKSERTLISRNVQNLEAEVVSLVGLAERLEEELSEAQRALALVNQSVGVVRERLAKTVSDLAEAERQLGRLVDFSKELAALQGLIDQWVAEVRVHATEHREAGQEPQYRINVFLRHFREDLRALGHSEVTPENAGQLHLDDRYVPYLGQRRLRSLGSASDHARLVAAYALSLAAAGAELNSPHPGFVILDEPLQQNPDPEHRARFSEFLGRLWKRENLSFQVIVFTRLLQDELSMLAEAGVEVVEPKGTHLLKSVEEPALSEDDAREE